LMAVAQWQWLGGRPFLSILIFINAISTHQNPIFMRF
jgi:hypothetical protein